MSTISEMVERLRSLARVNTDDTFRLLWGAADTIEILSEKVRSNNLHGEWIPVSERLPDLKTEVIYSFDGIVSTGYMTDRDYEGEKTESHWEDLESGVTIEPIAWMPLPPPYEGDDEHE